MWDLLNWFFAPENRSNLNWVGGGIAASAVALWTVFTFFYKKQKEAEKSDGRPAIEVSGSTGFINAAINVGDGASFGPTPEHIAQFQKPLKAALAVIIFIVVGFFVFLIRLGLPTEHLIPIGQQPQTIHPPTTFFTPVFLIGDMPIETRVTIIDGYDQYESLNVFASGITFELFDASNGMPVPLFKSNKRVSSLITVTLPKLPIRVISCLTFRKKDSKDFNTALSGFLLEGPQKLAGSGAVTPIGPVEVATKTEVDDTCLNLAKVYAKKNFAGEEALQAMTMADLAKLSSWSGNCTATEHATTFCGFYISRTNLARVKAGFSPNDLRFEGPPVEADTKYTLANYTVTMPNLGDTVFVSAEFKDGSKSDVKEFKVGNVPWTPRPVELVSDSGGPSNAFLAFNTNVPTLEWLLVAAPSDPFQQAFWSKDKAGFTPMQTLEGAFSAPLRLQDLDLTYQQPLLDTGSTKIWIKLKDANGREELQGYKLDPWTLARQTFRDKWPLEKLIACKRPDERTASWSRNAAFGAVCGFEALSAVPTLLLTKVWWGFKADELHDLDTFIAKQLPSELDALKYPEGRQAAEAGIKGNIRSWNVCANLPYASCGNFLLLAKSVSSVFFKIRYWDGKESDTIALPVK